MTEFNQNQAGYLTDGELSLYRVTGEPKLLELSQEQLNFITVGILKLFEVAFGKSQPEKINLVVTLAKEEGWTAARLKEAIKNLIKKCVTYYDRWNISEVMGYDKKIYTYSKVYSLCEYYGRQRQDFIEFYGADNRTYFWDRNNGTLPAMLKPVEPQKEIVVYWSKKSMQYVRCEKKPIDNFNKNNPNRYTMYLTLSAFNTMSDEDKENWIGKL